MPLPIKLLKHFAPGETMIFIRYALLMLMFASCVCRSDNFEFDQLYPWGTWMPYEQTEAGIRFRMPGTPDINHINGIGVIYLISHLPMGASGANSFKDLRKSYNRIWCLSS